MVKYNSAELDLVFSALSDQTRRGIIKNLTKQKRTAQELAAPFSISLPAVSKHLKVLERAGLIRREIRGRTHVFSLDIKSLQKASAWLKFHQDYWEQSLAKMEDFLINDKKR